MKVLVIGESVIDIVTAEDGSSRSTPGGAPLNIAIGLGRLGHDVAFLTDLGDDDPGRILREHLNESNVGVLAEPRGQTSTATAVLAEDGSAEYEFALRWEPDRSQVPAAGWSAVHFGSIAAFVHPGAEVLDSLLDEVEGDRTLLSFDPNIRPNIIGTHDLALARFEELAARTHLVKLSDVDANWLYPELTQEQQIDRILALGVPLVALTRGAQGSLLSTRAARRAVPVHTVEIRDTIGAGDAFMTSLIHDAHRSPGTLHDLDAEALHRLGDNAARISAITVGRLGANLPWAAEVPEIFGTDEAAALN